MGAFFSAGRVEYLGAPHAAAYALPHGQSTAGTPNQELNSVTLAMVANHFFISPARKGPGPSREAPTTRQARAPLNSRRQVGGKRKQPATLH